MTNSEFITLQTGLKLVEQKLDSVASTQEKQGEDINGLRSLFISLLMGVALASVAAVFTVISRT